MNYRSCLLDSGPRLSEDCVTDVWSLANAKEGRRIMSGA